VCVDREEASESEGGQIVMVCTGRHWMTCGWPVQAGGGKSSERQRMSGSGTEPVYPTVDLHTARSVCPPVLPFLLLCAPLNCSAHCSKA